MRSKKQKLFTKCLANAKEALDSIGVPFHISDGTCLGFYREEAFIEHDKDIDVGIFREDYKDEIIPAMVKHGFKFIKTFGSVDNGQEFTFEFNKKYLGKEVETEGEEVEAEAEAEAEAEGEEVGGEVWGEEEEISVEDEEGNEGEKEEEEKETMVNDIVKEYHAPKGSVRIDLFLIYRESGESDYYWYAAYTFPEREQIRYKISPFEVREEKFMGMTVRVPEVRYLDEMYGNWRKEVTDKDFNYTKCRNVSKPKFIDFFSGHKYDQSWEQEVTIGIKTFMRPHKLEKCLASVRRFYKDIRIIVADDSKDEFKKQNREICERYGEGTTKGRDRTGGEGTGGEGGVQYLELDWDVGLSAGRNAMVKACQTKYYITMDDDSLVKAGTNLKLFYNFLERKDGFHLIGGKCRTRPSFVCTYSHYSPDKTRLYYFNTDRGKISGCGGVKAIRTDRVMNFFMGRTEKLLENLWDEDLKLCEHNNFFIRAWKKKWKIAFTPLVVLFEDMSRGGVYLKYRNRYEKYRALTWKKTGRLVKLNGVPMHRRNAGVTRRGGGGVGGGAGGGAGGGGSRMKKKSRLSKSRITLKKRQK